MRCNRSGPGTITRSDPQSGRWEPLWHNQTIHAWARTYRVNHELPALADIVETDPFRRLEDTKSYPIAGSFLAYMLETGGVDRVKQFFRSGSREARRADIERQFGAAFEWMLADAETRWHAYLDTPAAAR